MSGTLLLPIGTAGLVLVLVLVLTRGPILVLSARRRSAGRPADRLAPAVRHHGGQ